MIDPVSPQARTELGRLVTRWHQLPVDQALGGAPTVLALAQRYADEVADAIGSARRTLPDLGPAAVPDQLTVTVYDVCRRRAEDAEGADDPLDAVAEDLAGLRRFLS